MYTRIPHPASFFGSSKHNQIEVREGVYKIRRKAINSCLEKQDSYSAKRHVRHTFRKGRIGSQGLKDQHDLDLIDIFEAFEIQSQCKVSAHGRRNIKSCRYGETLNDK